MKAFVRFEKKDFIGLIMLDREEAANALSRELLLQLQNILKQIATDSECRVVILTAAGEKAFCAGADLKERLHMTTEEAKDTVALIGQTIDMVEALPQPVIASLNGSAFGGGLELALACDLRIGHKNVKVGLTEVSLGIIPGAGGTQRLPRIIGISKAKWLIYSAQRIDAEKAMVLGLLDAVVEEAELLDTALQLAKMIAKQAPLAVQQAKKAINLGMDMSLANGLRAESLAYDKLFYTEDRLEGLRAFQEKREPTYKGR